jgi:hypothetical protein
MEGVKTYIERGNHAVGNKTILEWARVRTDSPRGIVFAPPLIGGNLSQQLITYRRLAQKGYDLVSFSYSGHGNSTDKFSLGATFRDTRFMLNFARVLSQKERIPLFGIASCYSAIPCLYAAQNLSEPFRRLVLVNALPKLGPGSAMISFLNYYRRIFTNKSDRLKEPNEFMHYFEFLFPGIMKSKDYFGVLERKRTRLTKTISEFFTMNPLKGVRLRKTPVLCFYASKDKILDLYNTAFKEDYENNIRELCSNVFFHTLEGGHYLSLKKAREEAVRHIDMFFHPCLNWQSAC